MIHKGTYDGTIYHNPANRFCIISVKTADKEVPLEARSTRRYRDHLIRFVATGYELPRTDAVDLELDGEWKQGKYGMQFQVEQWRQIVPRTKSGVEGYLASGLTREQMGLRAIDLHRVLPPRDHSLAPVSDPILELNNVALHYKKRTILHDISFTAVKGEVIGVVGHNGAGKTTFSRALCGLHKACDGQFFWNGLSMAHKDRLRHSYTHKLRLLPAGVELSLSSSPLTAGKQRRHISHDKA